MESSSCNLQFWSNMENKELPFKFVSTFSSFFSFSNICVVCYIGFTLQVLTHTLLRAYNNITPTYYESISVFTYSSYSVVQLSRLYSMSMFKLLSRTSRNFINHTVRISPSSKLPSSFESRKLLLLIIST